MDSFCFEIFVRAHYSSNLWMSLKWKVLGSYNLFLALLVQFYDKFNIRHNIAELLEYLWQVPSHRNAWRQVHSFTWFNFNIN